MASERARARESILLFTSMLSRTNAHTHTHTQVMEAAKAVGEHFIFRIDADLWFANSLALKEILLTELKLHTASLCVECVQGVRVL